VVRRQEEKLLLIGEVQPNSMDQMAQKIIRLRMSFEQLRQGYESLPSEARTNGKTESFALASGVLRAFLGADRLVPPGNIGLPRHGFG
jgi:hypothetical protein